MAEELSRLFLCLVRSTIMGHESGSFKTLNTPCPSGVVPHLTASFYNHVYDEMATKGKCKDDCGEMVKRMQACTGHSPVCLLNMLMVVTMNVHLRLDSAKLVLDKGYDEFMWSVGETLDLGLPSKAQLVHLFSHECSGEQEVEPLPEGQKMFYVGTTPPPPPPQKK